MTSVLNIFLTLLLNYGYPIIAVVIFASGLGAPLPATALVLAAGSLTVDKSLNFVTVVLIVAAMAILTDWLGYIIADRFRDVMISEHSGRFRITRNQLKLVDTFFARYGSWTIFFTRWLITPLGFPVNIIAGFHRYSMRKFLINIVFGELIWACLYTGLGYIFGASWQSILTYLNGIPQVLALISLGVFALWAARRFVRRRR